MIFAYPDFVMLTKMKLHLWHLLSILTERVDPVAKLYIPRVVEETFIVTQMRLIQRKTLAWKIQHWYFRAIPRSFPWHRRLFNLKTDHSSLSYAQGTEMAKSDCGQDISQSSHQIILTDE